MDGGPSVSLEACAIPVGGPGAGLGPAPALGGDVRQQRGARPARPQPPPGVLRQNDTSFPAKANAKLRELYGRYLAARADAADPEHGWASALKYYQYLVRTLMSNVEYGIGADGNARGLLLYHLMGTGKTRLAVGVAMALWDVRAPVVLLARGLQENFRATVAEVVALLHPEASPDALARMQAEAVARFSYVSLDAYNAAEQMARVGVAPGGRTRVRRGDFAGATGGLDGKVLIVDEAHNFFRAIINSAAENANARRMYDMVMGARDLRILFLTGTPAAKDPFELVPCFNMLAGRDLLPTQYEAFYKLYVDREGRRVRNRGALANRLVGLVSHVSPVRQTEPLARAAGPGDEAPAGGPAPLGPKTPGDDGWFPVKLPTIVERVPMGAEQYRRYLRAREKEEAEGKTGEGAGGRAAAAVAPPLALPGSEKKVMRSYFVKSRALSTFAPPLREGPGGAVAPPVDEMPDDAFTADSAPKLALIAERIDAAPGPALVYSQFVETSGLKPLGRFLRRRGYRLFVPDVAASAPGPGRARAGPPADSPIPPGPEEAARARAAAAAAPEPAPAEYDAEPEAGPAPEPTLEISAPELEADAEAEGTTGGDGPGRYRRVPASDSIDGILDQIIYRRRSTAIKTAPVPAAIEKAFARARKEGLLVSLTPPRSGYGIETIHPTLTPGPRPRDVLWLSRPETGGRSWYAFSKGFGLHWAGPGMAVVGYEIDADRLLRVDSPAAVEAFARRYGVCPEGVDPDTCATGSYIDWARVAIDNPGGVAFDPYLADAETARPDEGVVGPLWYLSLDAVTYVVWSAAAVKRVVVLYEPPAEAPAEGGAAVEPYREEPGGQFTHEGARYDLNCALAAADGKPIELIPVAALRWVLDHMPEDYFDGEAERARVERADLAAPILVAPTVDEGLPTVVDGIHRLRRALDTGVTHLPARRLTAAELSACLARDGGDKAPVASGPRWGWAPSARPAKAKARLPAGKQGARPREGTRPRGGGPKTRPTASRGAPTAKRAGQRRCPPRRTGGAEGPARGYYAIISGEVPSAVRDAIKAAFNSPANVRGAVIKALLVSKTGAEGLDLKYLREVHLCEPYWDQARHDQVEARAVRMGCLDALPREDRIVQCYIYLGAANPEVKALVREKDREDKTIDEVFYERARTRYEVNAAFRELLAEVSYECELFGYGKCRVCVPTNAPLFHDDPALDARLPDPCEIRCESDVQAAPLVVDGVTYFYAVDPASSIGYAFYVWRDDLGGHAAVDEADPVVPALLRALEQAGPGAG